MRYRRFFRYLAVALSLLVFPSAQAGTATGHQYYVSVEGSNSGEGSRERPWRSVQFAVDQLEPGDTLYVLEGVYRETVDMKRSGTPDAYITVEGVGDVLFDGSGQYEVEPSAAARGYAYLKGLYHGRRLGEWGEENPRFEENRHKWLRFIDREGIHSWAKRDPVFETKGHHYIRFAHFRVRNAWAGLEVKDSHHIVIEDFQTLHSAYGLRMIDASYLEVRDFYAAEGLNGFKAWGETHHVLIEDTEVFFFHDIGPGYKPNIPNGDGFIFERDTHHLTFRNVVAAYNADAGLDIKGNDVLLEGVVSFGNKNGVKFWGSRNVLTKDSYYFGNKSFTTTAGLKRQDGVGIHLRRGMASAVGCVIQDNEKENIKVVKGAKLNLERCWIGQSTDFGGLIGYEPDHWKGEWACEGCVYFRKDQTSSYPLI